MGISCYNGRPEWSRILHYITLHFISFHYVSLLLHGTRSSTFHYVSLLLFHPSRSHTFHFITLFLLPKESHVSLCYTAPLTPPGRSTLPLFRQRLCRGPTPTPHPSKPGSDVGLRPCPHPDAKMPTTTGHFAGSVINHPLPLERISY